MKTIFKLVIFLLILSPSGVSASHGMGGEITWECMPNNQYKFRLVFYRDCNGIPAPTSLSLTTTVPGVPSISMTRVQQVDISNQGLQANGVQACTTCVQGGGHPGLVEKNVYESGAISLNGVPPPAGWQFYWGECCRSNALNNINNPGSIGFRFRAVVFPYTGQASGICFRSSPYFVEKPMIASCTGFPLEYSYMVNGSPDDSLAYEWSQPLTDQGQNAAFAPGYSLNSQLPSATQNPNNQAAVLDPFTGHVSYLGFTGGNFSTSVKVTSYHCGVKISEIFREINLTLNNSCAPISGVQNLPPISNAPFWDPVTGGYTEYVDTVLAGDSVNFVMTFQDFQFYNNGTSQLITVEAGGNIFGDNFTSSSTGCEIPPCATFNNAMPASFPIAGSINFIWTPTNDHASSTNSPCPGQIGRYDFIIRAYDNYCPANASVTKTVTIYVLPSFEFEPPVLRCASVNADGSVNLNWSPTTTNDSLGIFQSYQVFASLTENGPYTFVSQLPGINTTSFVHSAASLNTLLGTTANENIIYYRLKSKAFPGSGSISGLSDPINTIKVTVTHGTTSEAVLNWNVPATPPIVTNGTQYKIFKEIPQGNWTLIDSTVSTTWSDFSTQILCDDSVSYRVELADATGCFIVSSVNGVVINDSATIATITISNPVVCTNSPVILTAFNGQSYLWSTGATTQSITVTTAGPYTVIVTEPGGCSAMGYAFIASGSGPNTVITSPAGFCAGASATMSAGSGFQAYMWNTGATTQFIQVNMPGTYTVTITGPNGCTNTVSKSIIQYPAPAPVITGSSVICQGTTTVFDAGTGYTNYLWNTGNNSQTITVSINGNYTVTVTSTNGCTGSASIFLTVNPSPSPIITASGPVSFCQGDSVQLVAPPGYLSYLWHRHFSPLTGAAQSTYYAKYRGNYYCMVTDNNGCLGSSSVISIPVPCIQTDPAVEKDHFENYNNTISVFPNPSHDEFRVVVEVPLPGNPEISIYDITGRRVVATIRKVNDYEFVLSDIKPGLYLLSIDKFRLKILRTSSTESP